MKKIIYIVITILLIFAVSFSAYAHPGSLDENGGHYNRKTGEYHYHEGKHTESSGNTYISPSPSPTIVPNPPPVSHPSVDNQKITNNNSSAVRTLVDVIIGTLLLGAIMWSWFILAEIYIAYFIKNKHKNFSENKFLSADSPASKKALKVCMFFSFFTNLLMSVAGETCARYPLIVGIFAIIYMLFLDYKSMMHSLSDDFPVISTTIEESPTITIDEFSDSPISLINEYPAPAEVHHNNEHLSVNNNIVDPYRVYWTPKGKTFHSTDKCITLRKSSTINQGMMAEAFSNGCTKPCSKCVGENYRLK